MLPPDSPTSAPTPPRLYQDGPLAVGRLELSERAVRHVQVLRLRPGDPLVLFDGDGSEWCGTLRELGRRAALVLLTHRCAVDRESPLAVHLVQGLCAAERMDFVLQKATELGVTTIQPVVAQRSVARLSAERQARRALHWRNVTIAACEQCGRNTLPTVHPLTDLRTWLGRPLDGSLRLLLAPGGGQRLRELPPPRAATVLIGPEGGLDAEESALAVAAGFVAVHLGPRILRTETAPLAAIAVMQSLWGDV